MTGPPHDGQTPPADSRGRADSAGARGFGLLGIVGLIGLLGAVVLAALRQLGDFDLPWHLRTGEQVMALGRGAAVDDFSYSFRGAPLILEWLFEVMLWLPYRALGVAGLHALAALAIFGIAAFVLLRAAPVLLDARLPLGARLAHPSLPLAIAATALALLGAGSWLVVKPGLLSFTCFAAVLFLVDRHRGGAPLAVLFALPPLQLAWANGHGFAPLGAVLAVGYALHVWLCHLAGGRLGGLFPRGEDRHRFGVSVVAVLSLSATAGGTYGLATFTTPVRFSGYEQYITEWTPTTPGFLLRWDPAVLVLVLATLGALLFGRSEAQGHGTPRSARLPSAFDVGVVLIFGAFGARSVRLLSLFAIAAAPIAARRLAPYAPGVRTLPLLGAALGLACGPLLANAPGTRAGVGWDRHNMPAGAVRFIEEARPAGRVFNFMPFGGYLILRLYPEVRVFIDGRTGWLYSRDFLAAQLAAEHDGAAFLALQEKWGFDWAVVRATPGERFGLPIARSPDWTMVYVDDAAAVYVRKDGPNAQLAAKGYHQLRHDMLPGWALVPGYPGPLPDEHDAALALAQDPNSPRPLVFVAAAALRRGDRAAAQQARDRMAAIDPDYPGLVLLDQALQAQARPQAEMR